MCGEMCTKRRYKSHLEPKYLGADKFVHKRIQLYYRKCGEENDLLAKKKEFAASSLPKFQIVAPSLRVIITFMVYPHGFYIEGYVVSMIFDCVIYLK